MKYFQNLLMFGIITLMFAVSAAAQSQDNIKNYENELKRYFEGKRVEAKIDMPATKDGIDVYPERNQAIDYGRYSKFLKSYGISVREGDRIMITKIKVKDKHIEFQLGGGGYGTAGDETSSSVYVPTAQKTRREKDLERDIRNETDERRRRDMRRELEYLRDRREREDNRNRAEAAQAEEIAKIRIQEKRLQGGSRFNIRFDRKLTENDLTARMIKDALAEYLIFDEEL